MNAPIIRRMASPTVLNSGLTYLCTSTLATAILTRPHQTDHIRESPNSSPYPMQSINSAYNAYGGSGDSMDDGPYQGEVLPAPPQGAALFGQQWRNQGSEQGHYQSYPPTNQPQLQHNPMIRSSDGSMTKNGSTLPHPINRPPLPAYTSHQEYHSSSYPLDQPNPGSPVSSSWRFTSPPVHSSMDPLRNSPYTRPPGMVRPDGRNIVVNNQDRPFKCDHCPQSFSRNHDLKRHRRIHLAVKPFPCPSCDKSFSRKDALKAFL